MGDEKILLSEIPNIWERIQELRITSIEGLAPKFKDSILSAMDDMKERKIKLGALIIDLDWYVFETLRTDELQRIYYAQGTTKAKTADYSWHKYGLAVDGISKRFNWFNNSIAKVLWPKVGIRNAYAEQWFLECGRYFEKYGCKLGAKWRNKDLPHVQWGLCGKTPILSPQLFKEGGFHRVWKAVRAI